MISYVKHSHVQPITAGDLLSYDDHTGISWSFRQVFHVFHFLDPLSDVESYDDGTTATLDEAEQHLVYWFSEDISDLKAGKADTWLARFDSVAKELLVNFISIYFGLSDVTGKKTSVSAQTWASLLMRVPTLGKKLPNGKFSYPPFPLTGGNLSEWVDTFESDRVPSSDLSLNDAYDDIEEGLGSLGDQPEDVSIDEIMKAHNDAQAQGMADDEALTKRILDKAPFAAVTAPDLLNISCSAQAKLIPREIDQITHLFMHASTVGKMAIASTLLNSEITRLTLLGTAAKYKADLLAKRYTELEGLLTTYEAVKDFVSQSAAALTQHQGSVNKISGEVNRFEQSAAYKKFRNHMAGIHWQAPGTASPYTSPSLPFVPLLLD